MAYAGITVPITLGQLGLLTDLPPSELPPNALITSNNIMYSNGVLQKAPGSLKYNSSPLDAGIVALHDWWPDTVKQRMIALTSAGSIYRDIGDSTFSGGTPIVTGLGAVTPNSQFVTGGQETSGRTKKLFLFTNGVNQLKVLDADGTTFADIANPAADWTTNKYPKAGVLHRNRLWAFQGQRAYASDTGDHEEFTSNFLTQSIFPGEGGDIIGGTVYKGRLFAFKEGSYVYFLDDSASSSTNWYWKKLSDNFGLSAPNAMITALDDMLAGNSSGTVTSYAATERFGDIESADIFRTAQIEQYIRNTLSTSGITEMHAHYYEARKLALFTYRTSYQTSNDMMIVYDVSGQQPRVSLWMKGTPQCLASRVDVNGVAKPMYGDASGYVQLMDYEDRLEGGVAYTGSFQTPHMDFRQVDSKLVSAQKHFDHLWVEFVPEGNWNVSIDVFIDGKFSETLTAAMQADGVYLDTFLLDTDWLAGPLSQTIRIPLHGTGRRISFKVYNSGSNQSFQIASMSVGFRPAGDGATRF